MPGAAAALVISGGNNDTDSALGEPVNVWRWLETIWTLDETMNKSFFF